VVALNFHFGTLTPYPRGPIPVRHLPHVNRGTVGGRTMPSPGRSFRLIAKPTRWGRALPVLGSLTRPRQAMPRQSTNVYSAPRTALREGRYTNPYSIASLELGMDVLGRWHVLLPGRDSARPPHLLRWRRTYGTCLHGKCRVDFRKPACLEFDDWQTFELHSPFSGVIGRRFTVFLE